MPVLFQSVLCTFLHPFLAGAHIGVVREGHASGGSVPFSYPAGKAKMTELLSSVIGATNYEALTKKIAAANRIYQSAANVLDLTRSLFDSARNVAELTAENTGKIGNALRESGAVYLSSKRRPSVLLMG